MNGDNVLYLAAWAVLLAVGTTATGPLYGQSVSSGEAPGPEWTLVVDGTVTSWPETSPAASTDSVRAVGTRVVDRYRHNGYYYARLDSAHIDTSAARPNVRLYVQRGPRVDVGRLRIQGASVLPAPTVRRLVDTEEGEPLNPNRLQADIQALLDRYEEMGHPLAQVRVTETALDTTNAPELMVTLAIEEGPKLWLQRITVPDDARTSPALLARLTDLRIGALLTDYDPETLRSTLQENPFFESVGAPELTVTSDGGAILHVPVDEAPPGAFDLVLGYLPPSEGREGGQLIGSGHLLLEHLFGGGRRFDLTLDRRPGQTSIFDLSVSDPYLFGLPLRVTGQFRGEQRDSTYSERTYGLRTGYELYRNFELTGRLSREVVKPGPAGAQLRGRRQHIPRSQTLFYGLGVRYESLDRHVNPRRGLQVDVYVDQGQKQRMLRRITAAGDTTRERTSLRQERLEGTVRAFLPLFERQVLVLGGDGAVLRSRAYDRSDLFRFGGATSLRGYDEDRFLGNVTARALLEYRLQLDRRSYLYAFGDLGYVERPAMGESSATQAWYPGYGLGLQIDTGIGLITTTYALNPDVATPADGRIHFGLSVGL
ncbi:hypothetical protein BSZ35_04740 [Salinibacter sp. 10B]|uniref:BamA/OMP85 family outer membrane protein n=1 Tax=Salinibacter sp. 10B TaxID=1923971 RepID=UPI000CF41A34|nr:BamA/TamA family outer membrane protein [Salinibacter sp. 10B]PQJ34012.1 hypothetical protein BSZ35_04740 [Salinibacter sp. 10B]